jgi:hypothetical protein
MCRIFDQTDEFWFGMVTACVIRNPQRRLAKVGEPNGRQKRRVERFRLGQAANTEINMVKEPSHPSSLPNLAEEPQGIPDWTPN